MKYATDITQLIGKTPLLKLNSVIDTGNNLVLAKLESFNPASSVKDRTALGMILAAEREGNLKPGGRLVEATSGNTGIALAMLAAARGYRLTVFMPETMSVERQQILKLFGAEVRLTPAHLGMTGAIDEANRLVREDKSALMIAQFGNPANPEIHEVTTALEIWNDTNGKLDALICGVGTGGTLTGNARVLKKKNKSIRIVAVEPQASAVLSGKKAGPHRIQGIGAGFVPKVLETKLMDDIITVSDSDALQTAKELAAKEGILAGISSGAAVKATETWIKKSNIEGKTIVVILPDSGERYLNFFN